MSAPAQGTIPATPETLKMAIAFFPSVTGTEPTQEELTWPAFVRRVSTFTERWSKGGRGFSTAQYKPETTRSNDGIEYLSAAVLEVDHAEPMWELLDGLEYFAFTSFSHHTEQDKCDGKPECPHWRITLPTSRTITPEEWTEFRARLRYWICPNADEGAKDLSRFNYLPHHKPGAPHATRHGKGRLLDPGSLKPVPEVVQQPAAPKRAPAPRKAGDEERPGDRLNATADWGDILGPHGALWSGTHGDVTYWRRPGKRDAGHSATTGGGGYDVLYMFTSEWPPFAPGESYTKFRAYSLLNHDGDDTAAARELAREFGMNGGLVTHEAGGGMAARAIGRRATDPIGGNGRVNGTASSTVANQPIEEVEVPPLWSPSMLLDEDERQAAARDTFLDLYMAYAGARTSAPAEFHEAIGLVALSAAVGRRAVLRLATGDVYAMIWAMIVADSTIYHKSTALDIGRELVKMVDANRLAPNDFTPQRFVAILAEQDGNPQLFFRDEVSGFYEGMNRLEHMAGLKELLCNVYDGRPFHRQKQKPKATKDGLPPADDEWKYDVKEPFLSMAVATTNERFFAVAEPKDLHSGFLPRYSMVVPQGPPPEDHDLREMDLALDSQRRIVVMKLGAIMNHPANLTCSKEALARLTRYGRDITHEAQSAPDRNMTNIVGSRIQWMAMRVAMLLAVADGSLRVDLPHLYRGIEIAERWRHTSLRMMSALAPSRFERSAVRLVDLVERKGPAGISRRDAMRALRLSKRDMDDLQATLAERGEIKVFQLATSGPPTFHYYATVALSQLSHSPLSQPTVEMPGSSSNKEEKSSTNGNHNAPAPEKRVGDSCDSATVAAERSLDDLFDEAVRTDGGQS